jgi:hypothetical protein
MYEKNPRFEKMYDDLSGSLARLLDRLLAPLRHKRPYLILISAILWMIFFPIWRDWVTATPLDVPISFAEKISVHQEVIIRAPENYDLNLVFDRRGVEFKTMKRLIGDFGLCMPEKAPCTDGIPVTLRWNFVDQKTMQVVISGDRETRQSHSWSPYQVDRYIERVRLPPGQYFFNAETAEPVPELAALRTRLTLHVGLKDISSYTYAIAWAWGQIIWYLLAPLAILLSISALIRREYRKRLDAEESQF